ncbi:MAG: glycosyltransferase family 2 protein [bacterium]|jgi:glycosyltransferase involved in cell wall biosynthesis
MAERSDPVVSVLMTSYNREKYIAAALESVLSSHFADFEVIVSDDASSDATVDIARAFAAQDDRVQVYVNQQNLGDYPNRNRAAALARGRYLKYVDSDDILYPHGLTVMVDGMERFPEAGFGLSCHPDPARPYPALSAPYEIYMEHFRGFGHFDRAPGSAIIRRDAFERTGGFSGRRMIGDNEFWLKIARHYPLVKLSAHLYWARKHEGQESGSDYARRYAEMRREVFEAALAHPECPLSATERSRALSAMRKHDLRNRVLTWLGR